MTESPTRASWKHYAGALAATAIAVALRWSLEPWLEGRLPLVTLPAAVAVAVYFGGLGPALLAAALGYLGCGWALGRLPFTAGSAPIPELVGLLAYLLSSGLIIFFGLALRRAGARAREEREALRVTLASIGDAVLTSDADGRVLLLNGVAEALTGWSQAEASGQPVERVFRIVDERTRKPAPSPVERALREQRPAGLASDTLLIAKDGSERPIADSAAPIVDREGRAQGCVLVFRDVSEQRAAQAALQRSQRETADFFEQATIALHQIGPDGRILRANRAELELLGYREEEYVGRRIADFHADPEVIADIFARLGRGESLREVPARLRAKDGSIKQVLITSSALMEDGELVHTRCFTLDVTDRERAEEALREADRRKTEFLAMLAHELRNPLAPIGNSVELMRLAEGDPELQRRACATIGRQLAHLARLVDDLLDVSRITRNKLELRKQPLELGPLILQVVENSRVLADCEEQLLEVSLASAPMYVEADPVRLAQVFGNLINNGCKYTPRGGSIRIVAEPQGEEVSVRITDSGVGIAQDQLERIFEMFAQVDSTLQRSCGGLGIGLTLVKRLVELHGGSIRASSAGAGRGSEFTVRLPLLREAAPRPARRAEARRRPARPRRILVVDDNEDNVTSLAALLRIAGHEVRVAFDGLEAVRLAEDFRPEVVLLDLGMPKVDGFEACRRIRAQEYGRALVLVALTGWGQDEDRLKSKQAGFDQHLVKPVDHVALCDFLDALEQSASAEGAGRGPGASGSL